MFFLYTSTHLKGLTINSYSNGKHTYTPTLQTTSYKSMSNTTTTFRGHSCFPEVL